MFHVQEDGWMGEEEEREQGKKNVSVQQWQE